MVRSKFQEAGVVRYVEMGAGEAKIQFNTVEDANRAVGMRSLFHSNDLLDQ